jgi:GPH family glycoside/pentoside/hexuronide:cation symporter
VVRIAFIAATFAKNVPLMMILFALSFLTCCSLGGTFNALVAEASEYTFRIKGKRIDGSMYSCTSFGMKVGGGLGSAISGWLLAASGFDAKVMVQAASVNNMLTFMFAGVPLIAGIIVLFIYFKLNVQEVNAKAREEANA